MEKMTAIYNGQTIYVHYVSKFMEYLLVSYTKDEERKFKVGVPDVSGIDEKVLMQLLQEQELKEQLKGRP